MNLSVIIPVYNTRSTIERCVQSVRWCDEVILVDDGSTDDSGSICDQLCGENIHTIHIPHQGLSVARNEGVRHATKEYIAFLDADDYWLPFTPPVLNTDLILFHKVDYEGDTLHYEPLYDLPSGKDVFMELLQHNRLRSSACFMFIKRTFLLQHQLFFTPDLYSEDIDWTIRLWLAHPTISLFNKHIYVYCHHKGSISTSFGEGNMRSYEIIFTTWQHDPHPFIRAFLSRQYVSCLYYQIAYPPIRSLLLHYVHLLDGGIDIRSHLARLSKRFLGTKGMLWLFRQYSKWRFR